MERDALLRLLREVRAGKTSVPEAMERLRHQPIDDLGFAKLDLHRAIRKGFPEVVYGPGKTTEQIVAIVDRLRGSGQTVLVTRVGPEAHDAVRGRHAAAEYHPLAHALVIRAKRSSRSGRVWSWSRPALAGHPGCRGGRSDGRADGPRAPAHLRRGRGGSPQGPYRKDLSRP